MIRRIWHGWTKPENADAYESLLRHEIFLGIQERQIAGFRGIELLRRSLETEVEFITIMGFDSIEAVRAFGGRTMKQRSSLRRRGLCSRDLTSVPNTMRS
jgi:heme-degrading monooxygenase HmoA